MITEPKKRDIALVVDDSPETLRLLTDALDGAGMTVMVAMDGAAAMRIVDQITPDIILLDAVMPGIDRFETCRRLNLGAATDDALELPDTMGQWLEQAQKGNVGPKAQAMAVFPDNARLRLQYMG